MGCGELNIRFIDEPKENIVKFLGQYRYIFENMNLYCNFYIVLFFSIKTNLNYMPNDGFPFFVWVKPKANGEIYVLQESSINLLADE